MYICIKLLGLYVLVVVVSDQVCFVRSILRPAHNNPCTGMLRVLGSCDVHCYWYRYISSAVLVGLPHFQLIDWPVSMFSVLNCFLVS